MIIKMYAVYDLKAGVFTQPFGSHNDGTAIRSFTDRAQRPESQESKHPEDYGLYYVGDYDDTKGHFSPAEAPKPLGLANEFLKHN